jgi:hypothetical protein
MINFSKVERSVRELKSQLESGKIDQVTFEDRLLQMIDVASDGYYWMFGHESERWFRHDGQQWVPDIPAKLPPPPEDEVVTPNSNKPTSHYFPEQNLVSEWRSVNWGWFVTSLFVIGLIAWIAYASSLT